MRFPRTVTLERMTAETLYGEASFDSPEILRCRITTNAEDVRTLTGEVVTSNVRVTFPGDPGISYSDRITLPDGSTSPIVTIRKPSDQFGAVHHTDLLF